MSPPARRPLRHTAWLLLGVVACLQLCPAVAGRQQEAQDYIVVFKRGFDASRVAALCAEQAGGQQRSGAAAAFKGLCRKRFSKLLNGFAGSLAPADVDALLAAFPGAIDHIERDAHFSITGEAQPEWLADEVPAAARQQRRRGLLAAAGRAQRRAAAAARRRLPEQADPTWNIDRVDQAALPLDHLYRYDHTGTGVNVYLLDTGIRFTHQEFRSAAGDGGVRARPGFSVFGDGDSSDCNGHGTHTAATVGGLTYGVAKNVTLWAVRAMDCAGGAKVSAILDAFEWIAENAVQPAVVSMSVAGDLSPAVNEAARRLVEDRLVPLVVAAGNSQENACLMSPASSPWAVSVAAADDQDQRWAKSNWGPCVDVHGPGVAVLSAGYQSDGASAYKTGTSMATPHVTGVLALYLEEHPGASPQELRQKLNAAATADAVRNDPDGFGSWDLSTHPASVDLSTTPNRLLYSLLPSQASLSPSVLVVSEPAAAPLTVTLALSAAPTADVTVTVNVPLAGWANAPLAVVSPATLTIPAAEWASPQTLTLEPSGLVDGTYHVQLQFESADPRFDGMQAVRVDDRRALTGDGVEAPRVVGALPFSDSDTSSRFSAKFQLGAAAATPGSGGAPDVVYAFTPAADVAVDISTCGSLFDTQLYVVDDPQNMQAYVGNDDDPSCAANPKASRVSTTLQAGITYYIIVDGYAGDWLSSQGVYTLAITPAAAAA